MRLAQHREKREDGRYVPTSGEGMEVLLDFPKETFYSLSPDTETVLVDAWLLRRKNTIHWQGIAYSRYIDYTSYIYKMSPRMAQTTTLQRNILFYMVLFN